MKQTREPAGRTPAGTGRRSRQATQTLSPVEGSPLSSRDQSNNNNNNNHDRSPSLSPPPQRRYGGHLEADALSTPYSPTNAASAGRSRTHTPANYNNNNSTMSSSVHSSPRANGASVNGSFASNNNNSVNNSVSVSPISSGRPPLHHRAPRVAVDPFSRVNKPNTLSPTAYHSV
jgi:hypothetical protein